MRRKKLEANWNFEQVRKGIAARMKLTTEKTGEQTESVYIKPYQAPCACLRNGAALRASNPPRAALLTQNLSHLKKNENLRPAGFGIAAGSHEVLSCLRLANHNHLHPFTQVASC